MWRAARDKRARGGAEQEISDGWDQGSKQPAGMWPGQRDEKKKGCKAGAGGRSWAANEGADRVVRQEPADEVRRAVPPSSRSVVFGVVATGGGQGKLASEPMEAIARRSHRGPCWILDCEKKQDPTQEAGWGEGGADALVVRERRGGCVAAVVGGRRVWKGIFVAVSLVAGGGRVPCSDYG